MSNRILENYLKNFTNDCDRLQSLVEFAKTTISFIIEKQLYVEFLKYSANEAEKEV